MASFTSTANEPVAEAAPIAYNSSTTDEDVGTLASTVDEAVAKAASTADEDVGPRHGGTAEWRMLGFWGRVPGGPRMWPHSRPR